MTRLRALTFILVGLCCPLPAASQEAESWEPYKFIGTEHFRYEMSVTENGDTQTGWYTLDLEPAGGDQLLIKLEASMGESRSAFSTTAPADAVYMQLMTQMAMSPAGAPMMATLLAPWWGMYFAGRDWTLGAGWSFNDGTNEMSFKVEALCEHAGVEGKSVVWREGGEVRAESCIAPQVALPLFVSFRDDRGSLYQARLEEYRP
jgi:hypothetical protein